ncbi:MAG: sulfite reductase subunit alpha [Verrucomicrobia bacterium]|nr:sulfite reductase subunit alpha [Verrucomicrobiota bacterium]
MSLPAATAAFSKDHPFPAKFTDNRLLTKTGSAKETRHFAVNLAGSGLTYKVGDSLGVCPTNRAEEVAELLAHLGATGDELVSPVNLRLTEPIKLRDALTTRLALAGPTAKMITTLAAHATDAGEKAKLEALLDPAAKETLTAFLAQREFVDLLCEFPSAKLTPQVFVDHMRKLMPRLYSIASSPKLYPEEIHLTVVVVRYSTNGRGRGGVCSTYMADRVPLNQNVAPVFVSHSHFGLPEDHTKDVIMVGPGTGIAPFRAFMQERVATGATGRNWVFFGDQHRTTDFLYEEEWLQYEQQGKLAHLSLAWSRDQAVKVYVQDKMRENAAELWAWIKGGASFYVCGDAKHMAKDVDATLHAIIAEQGIMDAAAAAEYVKQMKKDKRYQRDVY